MTPADQEGRAVLHELLTLLGNGNSSDATGELLASQIKYALSKARAKALVTPPLETRAATAVALLE